MMQGWTSERLYQFTAKPAVHEKGCFFTPLPIVSIKKTKERIATLMSVMTLM